MNYGPEGRPTTADLEKKYREMVTDPLSMKSVMDVNFDPHPFVIGVRHVTHASDVCSGRLGLKSMRAHGCAERGCGRSLDEHSFDRVMVVSLKRNAGNEEVAAVLKPIADRIKADGDDLEGFVFAETSEKFRVTGKGE